MSDCGAFEAKYKDLTPNSKPEDAQPLMEALKEVNQMRLLNSNVQKLAEDQAAAARKNGLLISHFAFNGGESQATILQREGKLAAIELKHADGNSETLRYDIYSTDQGAKPTSDTINIACPGKPITSNFDFDNKGNFTKNYVTLPNNLEIEADATGKVTHIRKSF
ncbi:MAG TPA: hypothetical protein V6D22_17590 [Candidatus Obscuribacterales bacterium]